MADKALTVKSLVATLNTINKKEYRDYNIIVTTDTNNDDLPNCGHGISEIEICSTKEDMIKTGWKSYEIGYAAFKRKLPFIIITFKNVF